MNKTEYKNTYLYEIITCSDTEYVTLIDKPENLNEVLDKYMGIGFYKKEIISIKFVTAFCRLVKG